MVGEMVEQKVAEMVALLAAPSAVWMAERRVDLLAALSVGKKGV